MTGRRNARHAVMLVLLSAGAACSGSEQKPGGEPAKTPSPAAGVPAPAPGGKTIVIEMITDETGNYFKPAQIEAHRGDMLRFELKVGVHNVNFLPDSNSIKTGLPAVSDMLQLPGQTYDVVVNFEPGVYYFQCDPHALLGMKGHVKVSPE